MVLVLVAILSLTMLLLVGCGKTLTDDFYQFIPPSSDVIDSDQTETDTGVKTQLSTEAAVAMLFDTIVNAKVEDDSNLLEFSFAPYFETVKNGVTKRYTLSVNGSIDTENNNNSLYSFEIITSDDSRVNEEYVILGIYGKDGNMYIDSRNYETNELVHAYFVDDMDISLVMTYLDKVMDQLDAAGFIEKFDIGALMETLDLDPTIATAINKFIKLDGTLLELLFSLISDSGCYVVDNGNGVTQMVLPCKIGDIMNSGLVNQLVGMLTSSLSASIQPVLNGVIDLLIGGFATGTKKLATTVYVDIENNVFQKASMEALITNNNATSEYEIGLGELSFTKDVNFRNKILGEMEGVVKEGRTDYSFTTFSADLEITLNLNEHTYTLGQIDSVLGNSIAGLLGGVDGQTWTGVEDMNIDIAEDMVISLHLKLRAEINLKDNNKTMISLELMGTEDDVLRLGVYYKGADNAMYVDMSGMGGGKVKIDTYDAFEVSSEGRYVMTSGGAYRLYTSADGNATRYAKVTKALNLNKIIIAALDKYIPEIPSILEIVNGLIDGSTASEEGNYSEEYMANMNAVREALLSGDVIVPHFLDADSDTAAVSSADESGEVDIMSLITGILGCAELERGDTRLSVKSLGIFMTQDVIDTLMNAIGFDLPVTQLDILISQTEDDYESEHPTAEEGWTIQINLAMAKDYGNGLEDLLDAEVYLYLNYGNPDAEFKDAFLAKDFSNFVDIDFFRRDDTGELDNMMVGAALEARFKFTMTDDSTLDLSPIGQLLYGLTLKLKSEDEIYIDLGVEVAANANIITLVKLIKGETDIADLLSTLEARIDIIKYASATDTEGTKAIMLYINKGVLYVEAPTLGMPKYKIDILSVIDGDMQLFSKDTASAAYVEDNAAESEKPDLLAILVAALSGVKIDNSKLEVLISETLISTLMTSLGLDFSEVGEIRNEGTSIVIQYDGLNLSELWIQANIGIQQNDTELSLGLGLGHVAITVGGWTDLAEDIVESEYIDLLNGGNIFLGAQLEIALFLKEATGENTITLDNMLGAVLADIYTFDTEIDITETLDGSIYLSLMFDLDISSAPSCNDTKLLIELRKRYTKDDNSTGDKLLMGLYYDAVSDTLYLDTDGTVFQPVALKNIGLIDMIKDLLTSSSASSALASADAAADIDLSGLNPVIILSNKGVQIQVMQGITNLIVEMIAGDFNDYIDYENSYRYYLDDGAIDADTAARAHTDETTGDVLHFQKNPEKFVYIDGAFVNVADYDGDPTELTKYAYFEGGVYEKIYDPTDDTFAGISEDRLNQAVAVADGSTYKIYAYSGGDYIQITDENSAQYESAAKYAKFLYKDVALLNAGDTGYDIDTDEPWTAMFNSNGLPVYIRTTATAADLNIYNRDTTLNLPEIGVTIAIGELFHTGNNDLTFTNGIGIGIFFADKTTGETTGSVGIKLGNIKLNKSSAVIGEEELGFEAYFDYLAGKVITDENPSGTIPSVDLDNITDLTVYINLALTITMGAFSTADENMTDSWAIGGLLSAVLGDSVAESDQSALMAFIRNLMLTFNIPVDLETEIGLRIAGNLNIGALLSEGETNDNIVEMLYNSEVAVELTIGGRVVLSIYLEEDADGVSWVYINGNGSLIANTKFKIQLSNIINMVSGLSADTVSADESATASADEDEEEDKSILEILMLIDGALGNITITRESVYIGLGAQFLTTVVGLIADVEGITLPELNESNSFIELNTSAESPYFLKLGIGIDPVYLALSLGGLEIGLSPDADVIPDADTSVDGDQHLYEDIYDAEDNPDGYKTVSDLAENVSMKVEIGLDAELYEGLFDAGGILSTILQATGTNIDIPLAIDVQEDMILNLRIQIAANLNLLDLDKSDLKLAIVNIAEGNEETILALYFTYDTVNSMPVLYVENNFTTNSGKHKIENFSLLNSLLGETTKGIVRILGGKLPEGEGGAAAFAAADGEGNEAEIIMTLTEHNIQLAIGKELVTGLLSALIPDGITPEIEELINDLNLGAAVNITTATDEEAGTKLGISVEITSNYFKLALMINEPQISLNKIDIFNGIDFEEFGIDEDDTKEEALGLEFGIKINYDVGNGIFALDSLINDLAGADFALGEDGSIGTIGKLMQALTLDIICQNTRGYIGINVKLNVLSAEMNEYLPAAGVALADTILGKLDENYEISGETFDALTLLNMIEAGIILDLNGKKVWISLVHDDVEGVSYLCFTLSGVGGSDFKLPLATVIESIKAVSSSSDTAFAVADEEVTADKDYTLINAILNNAFSSISIAKTTGLDIALNKYFVSYLIGTVVADLIGDTFHFSEDTKALFTLTDPYILTTDAQSGTEFMDENYYAATEIVRYVELVDYLPGTATFNAIYGQSVVNNNVYYNNGEEYVSLVENDGVLYYATAVEGADPVYTALTMTDGKYYVNTAAAGEAATYTALTVFDGKFYKKITTLDESTGKNVDKYYSISNPDTFMGTKYLMIDGAFVELTNDNIGSYCYISGNKLVTLKANLAVYVKYDGSYKLLGDTIYPAYIKVTEGETVNYFGVSVIGGTMSYVDGAGTTVELGSAYAKVGDEYVLTDGDDLLYYLSGEHYVALADNTQIYIRYAHTRYTRVALYYTSDEGATYTRFTTAQAAADYTGTVYTFDGTTYTAVADKTAYLSTLYRKIEHSGITWNKANGLKIKLLFAENNGRHGFSFELGVDATLSFSGEAIDVLPDGKSINDYDVGNLGGDGNISLSFVIHIGAEGGETASEVNLTDFIEAIVNAVTEEGTDPIISTSDFDTLESIGGLILGIAEGELASADIRVTLAANLGTLIGQLTSGSIDAASLLGSIELAIEILYSENLDDEDPANDVKGGLYLYGGNLYIDYEDEERGVFAMNLSSILAAIGDSSASSEDALAAEGNRTEAALLQLWLGEYVKFNGVATTGLSIKITTELVGELLSVLLGIDKDLVANTFGTLDAEIAISLGAPQAGIDGIEYYNFGTEESPVYINSETYEADGYDIVNAEGYDAAYPEVTVKYILQEGGEYIVQPYYVDQDSFEISIGLRVNTLVFGISLGKFALESVENSIVSQSVLDYIAANGAPTETVIDLGLNLDVGVAILDQTTYVECDTSYEGDKFINSGTESDPVWTAYNAEEHADMQTYKIQRTYDLGALLDQFNLIEGVSLAGLLNINVPEGGVAIKLSLALALSINLTNIDKSVAEISVLGQIYSDYAGNVAYDQKELAVIYYKNGEVLLDLSGLGFGRMKVSGLVLSNLFGTTSGIEAIMGLLNSSSASSSSALATADAAGYVERDNIAILLNPEGIAIEIGKQAMSWILNLDALGLNKLSYVECESDYSGAKYVKVCNETAYIVYDEYNADHSNKTLYVKVGDSYIEASASYAGERYIIDGDSEDVSYEIYDAAVYGNDVKLYKLDATYTKCEAADESHPSKFVLMGTNTADTYVAYDVENAAHADKTLYELRTDGNYYVTGDSTVTEGKYVCMADTESTVYAIYNATVHSGLQTYRTVTTAETLSGLNIDAIVEIITDGGFAVNIKASAADLLGINISINNIQIGSTGVAARVEAVNADNFPEAIKIRFVENATTGEKELGYEVVLEKLALSIQLDLNAIFTNGMYIEEGESILGSLKSIVGVIANSVESENTKGISVRINLELDLASIINLIDGGLDTNDIYAALSAVLPLVTAQVSIYTTDGTELLGVYVYNGNVYVVLEGLGLPNIMMTNDYLLKVVKAVASSQSAALAVADEESSLDVVTILSTILDGIYFGEKSLMIALTNDYFADLLDMVVLKGSSYYHDVMPENNDAFSGIKLNLGNLVGENREGLVQVDLDMYGVHINLDLMMPVIAVNENVVVYPAHEYVDASTVNGVSLSLALQLKIDKNNGVALGNILKGVVGDLGTALIIEDDIDLRIMISAAVKFSYDLTELSFSLDAIDAEILISRYYADTDTSVDLLNLYYVSSEGALYVDMSYFMQSQDPTGERNLGKLKVTGIDLIGILTELLASSSSVDASASALYEDPWVENSSHTQLYVPATAENTAAPATYSRQAALNEDLSVKTEYINYRIGSTDTVYVYDTATSSYRVYNAETDAEANCYVKLGDAGTDEDYSALYVSISNGKSREYVNYVKGESAYKYKAKYIQQTVYEYVEDAEGDYVKAYDADSLSYCYISKNSYVYDVTASTFGEIKVTAETMYAYVGGVYELYSGTEQQQTADCYVKVGDQYLLLYTRSEGAYTKFKGSTVAYSGETLYTRFRLYDPELDNGSVRYVSVDYDGVTKFELYATYAKHITAPVLYEYVEGTGYTVSSDQTNITGKYVIADIYGLSAVWADCSVADYLKVSVTGKAMLGLIGAFVDNAQITDIMDNLLIAIYAETNPFLFAADIDLLDPYNNYTPALGLTIGIYGFDQHEFGNDFGSSLTFGYTAIVPENAANYRTLVDIDLNKIINAADIMDVLFDSLDFGENGKLYLNASVKVSSYAKNGTSSSWADYLAGFFGLSAEEIQIFYDVVFTGDGRGAFNLDISAAIDVQNLIGGLLSGSGLNLDGTEIKITIDMDTMLFAQCLRDPNSKIEITVIGKDTDGLTGVYLDLSGYRNGGKHKVSLDLASLLGDALSSSGATATADMGLIGTLENGELIWTILNALVGEVRLGGGRITIGLTDDFLGEIFNLFAGMNLDEGASTLVSTDVYLDVRNLALGVDLWLGDRETNEFYIGINIGNINLAATEEYVANGGTFVADKDTYTDIRELKLDVDFTAEIFYEGDVDGSSGISINALIETIGALMGTDLFENPNFNIVLGEDIDAVYTLKANVHLDFANFDNMRIALEVYRTTNANPTPEMRLGLYIDGHNVYIDLSGLGLPKLSITGVNLGATLDDAIGGLLEKISGEGSGTSDATASSDATYVDEDYRSKWGIHIMPTDPEITSKPFISLLLAENHFGLSTNGLLINALLDTLSPAIGTTIQLPDLGTFALTFDSTADTDGDGLEDLQTELVFQTTDNFYWGFRSTNLSINGNRSSSQAETLFNSKDFTAYTNVYNVETGEIGVDRVNLGFDLTIRQDGANTDGTSQDGFEHYLNTMIESLLGVELPIVFNVPDGENVIGYDLTLRASLSVASLVAALDGEATVIDQWWQDIELYLDMVPMGYDDSYLLRLYKDSGSADVYADLTGMSLFKVKIVGLGGLLGGALSSSGSAVATADREDAEAADSTQSNFTLTLNQNGIQIDIGMGVINGILGLLGSTLTIGNQGYYIDESTLYVNTGTTEAPVYTLYDSTNADHAGLQFYRLEGEVYQPLYLCADAATSVYSAYAARTDITANSQAYLAKYVLNEGVYTVISGTMGYTTISIGDTTIPIPVLNSTKALSIGLTYGSAVPGEERSIGLTLGLGLDEAGNAIRLGIDNLHLSVGANDYVNRGATNGQLNSGIGENVFANISGTNANSFSGLMLSDAYGISLLNILTDVIGGIDPNITIYWRKNTNHYYNNSDRESYSTRLTTISLSRTDAGSTNSNGDKVGAGKFQAYIDSDGGTSDDRIIYAWLYNNTLYLDIGQTLNISLSFISAVTKLEVTKLDILSLVGGLAAGGAASTTADDSATATADNAVAAEEEEGGGIADTLTSLLSSVEVNWWYNVTDPEFSYGSNKISSLRININPEGFNSILLNLYYTLYTMYNANAVPTADNFKLLPYDVRYTLATSTNTVSYEGETYTGSNAYQKCVVYLQTYAATTIGTTVNSILEGMLTVGGSFGNVLRDIIGNLLPLPLLKEGYSNYLEVVLDKSQIKTAGVIKEIGVYINMEKTSRSGNTITRVTSLPNGASSSFTDGTAAIAIIMGSESSGSNALELRSVQSVKDYDSGNNIPNTSTKTVFVADPFDPVELSAASLAANSNLISKVDASFYGLPDYTSKTSNNGDELGGTKVVWDTSTVSLIPGATSTMSCYALNYKVQTVTVTVGQSTGFARLYGYINANGEFVQSNSITIDPTLDPTAIDATTMASLPNIIVIMRKDGQLQMLDLEYEDDTVYSGWLIDGATVTPAGKFEWFEPSDEEIANGGLVSVDFWYQVTTSSRIRAATNVTYNNSKVKSMVINSNDPVYGILTGGFTADDFTAANIDIIGNLGMPSIKAADVTVDETTGVISSKFKDGSVFTFTVSTGDVADHVAGLTGTFTRTFRDAVLQSGDYVYTESVASEASLIDKIKNLFSSVTSSDSGYYSFSNILNADGTPYVGLNTITVNLASGFTSEVEVLTWNYDELSYSMEASYKGAKGKVTAVINRFNSELNTDTIEAGDYRIVNDMQNIDFDVNIRRYQLDSLAEGNLEYNQYNDLFVKADGTGGAYVLNTYVCDSEYVDYDPENTVYAESAIYVNTGTADAPVYTLFTNETEYPEATYAKYVKRIVTGYVLYNQTTMPDVTVTYNTNIFGAEREAAVKVKYQSLASYTEVFDEDDFTYYTEEITVSGEKIKVFEVPALTKSSEAKIEVIADYSNGAYTQSFDYNIIYTEKEVEKVVVFSANGTAIDSILYAMVYFSDGTSLTDVAIKDIVCENVNGIKNNGTAEAPDYVIEHKGTIITTATIGKIGADGITWLDGFVQAGATLEIRSF